jgi:hypothetical protein
VPPGIYLRPTRRSIFAGEAAKQPLATRSLGVRLGGIKACSNSYIRSVQTFRFPTVLLALSYEPVLENFQPRRMDFIPIQTTAPYVARLRGLVVANARAGPVPARASRQIGRSELN